MFLFDPYACKCFVQIGSSKDNDRSPENKQVFLNSSLVSKRFFNWSRQPTLQSMVDQILNSTRIDVYETLCP